jgi:catechol 2,3-dioxygenase-like lactoylglutathione lyase family enzyme
MKKYRLLLSAMMLISFLTLETMAQSEFASDLIGIGVVVSDLEKSLDFYTSVVGMKVVSEFDVAEDFSQISGLARGVPFNVKVLKLEDSSTANQWKLMSFKEDASHPMPKNIQDDTGMQYITIMVNSLAPFIERIKKHNVKLLGDTPVQSGENRYFVLIQDPDGTFIELIGPLE